jgi:hypothetical protein
MKRKQAAENDVLSGVEFVKLTDDACGVTSDGPGPGRWVRGRGIIWPSVLSCDLVPTRAYPVAGLTHSIRPRRHFLAYPESFS